MPVYTNALAPRPSNSLAYPGGIGKRGGSLDSFVPLDYSRLAAGQFRQDTPQMREYAANVPLDVLRGRFAGMLGFPSDVLNMFRTPLPMEMFGQTDYEQPTQVPYGTEQLLKTLPLAPAADNPLGQAANRVGSFVPITPMEALQAARVARQAAMATGRFVAPKAGQLAEQYMVRTGGILPLDVYHGSPHRLPPTAINPLGEFDASKIGTGAGAQARGYGIYTSESPEFADYYAMRKKTPDVEGIASQNGLQLGRDAQVELMRQATRDSLGKPAKGDNYVDPIAAVKKLQNASIEARQMPVEQLQNTIREFQEQNRAYLYKADLPDKMIPKMLDYDKHLSEQSSEVQKILLPYQKEIGTSFGTGQQILKEIAFQRRMKGLDDSPPAVAQQLKEMGIPGVVYKELDTRNFVTFPGEEKKMKILERKTR